MIQVYITSARRAYELADHYRRARRATSCLGGLHVTSLPDEAARARRHDLPRARARTPGRAFLADFRAGRAAAASTARRCARSTALPPIRRDLIKRQLLPRAQLDRGLARLPARLRLLLQGRVLRGRPRRSTRSASTTRSPRSSGCPAATSTSSTTTCSATARFADGAVRRHARHGPAVAGRRHGQLDPAPGPAREGGGLRAAQPVRRLRDARTRATCARSASARTCTATTARRSAACTTSA